jgi:hypothetical protein
MMLVCPATTNIDTNRLLNIFNDCLNELTN